MKILKNYLLIQLRGVKRKKSGLILPENVKDDGLFDTTCEVMQIGPDVKDVKIGDTVLLKQYRLEEGKNLIKNTDDEKIAEFFTDENSVIAVLGSRKQRKNK